jgi:hypothetical protein
MIETRSKRNALALSAITVLSFTFTGAILNLLLPYWLTGNIHTVIANPESLTQPGSLLVLILFLTLILGIMIALGTFWLYRFFGEAHFGDNAGLRWALFGVSFAIFLKLPDWLLPASSGIILGAMQFIGLFAAYFLSRTVFPLQRKGA